MRSMTIRQALRHVADYPEPITDEWLQVPVYELVARTLFDIANRPDVNVRGSMGKANKARKLILERMDGTRRSGSHPATRNGTAVEFIDMTGGELE